MMMRILLTSLLVLAWLPLAATEIYKTYDEHGNVVYTDQKPSDDAEPIDLPNLTIMDPVSPASPRPAQQPADAEPEELTFRIASPEHEEHIRGTGNTLPVQLDSSISLPPGALVVLYLDGRQQPPIKGLSTTLGEIDRGEHRLRAELRTASGRVLASSEEVTFYMRQASALHPRSN